MHAPPTRGKSLQGRARDVHVVIVVAHLIVVVGSIAFVWRLRCAHRDVERRLALHAWQLAQLVPDAQPPPPAPAARPSRTTPSPLLSGQATRRGKRLRSAT